MSTMDARTRQVGAIAAVEARLALLGDERPGEPANAAETRRRLLAKLDELRGGVPPDAITPPAEPAYRPRTRRDVDD